MHCQEVFLMIVGAQLRAARALLNWSASEVADKSSSTRNTIQRLEQSAGIPSSKIQTILIIKKMFEDAGVEFIGSPDNGPGVRLRPKD
jgi:transcriptional regulator with XRE-family HTH domain